METGFTVRQGRFEGPLDLLLTLIEERKLHISDISLARVADDFIVYLQSSKEFPIAESAHFILIASTLLLVKSKSLLPNLALTTEEEESIEELEMRLKLYERFRKLAHHVRDRFGKVLILRGEPRPLTPTFTPGVLTTLPGFLAIIRAVIRDFPLSEVLPQAVIERMVSLEDTIEHLTTRIMKSIRLSFKEFSRTQAKTHQGLVLTSREERLTVIMGFLAMLELVKRGVISVMQDRHFGDIVMQGEVVGTPRYM